MSNTRDITINAFVFIGQIAYPPEPRYTATGKAVCTIKVRQLERASNTEKGYYERWFEVDLWDDDAAKIGRVKAGAWVEITGKLTCGKKEVYAPDERRRVKASGIISPQLVDVRVIEDRAEIEEYLEVLIDAHSEPRSAPSREARPAAKPHAPSLKGKVVAPAGIDPDDPNADIPF